VGLYLRVLFLFDVFRIISAGTEMDISNEKNSGRQQLHWDFKDPGSKA